MRDLDMSTDNPNQGTAPPLAVSLDPYLAGIRQILRRHVGQLDDRVEQDIFRALTQRIVEARPAEHDLTGSIQRNLKDIIKSLGQPVPTARGEAPNPLSVAKAEALLRKLPAEQRQALGLYFVDEIPIARIVQMMGIPATDLAELLSRARRALGSEVALVAAANLC